MRKGYCSVQGREATVWSGVSFICNEVLSPQEYDFEYGVNTYQQTQITYFIQYLVDHNIGIHINCGRNFDAYERDNYNSDLPSVYTQLIQVWEKNFEPKKGREQHVSSFQIFATTFPIT